jgi:hypothetical protein
MLLIMHHISRCTPCITLYFSVSYLCICNRPRRAKIGSPSDASPKGVGWSTSVKCEDTNISFGSRQALVHLTLSLSFVYNFILFMILGCTLGNSS